MKLITYIKVYNRVSTFQLCEEEIKSIRNEIFNEYYDGVNMQTLKSIVRINMQDGLDKCYILNVVANLNKTNSFIQ